MCGLTGTKCFHLLILQLDQGDNHGNCKEGRRTGEESCGTGNEGRCASEESCSTGKESRRASEESCGTGNESRSGQARCKKSSKNTCGSCSTNYTESTSCMAVSYGKQTLNQASCIGSSPVSKETGLFSLGSELPELAVSRSG